MYYAQQRGNTGTPKGVEAFSIQTDVPGGPGAARRARGLVRRALSGRVPAALLGDVTLLVTELVANGVRHGGADEDSTVHLSLEGRPATLRVEVADPGRRADAVAPRHAAANGGGMGLQIVERLATRWGVGDGPQTSVWFELDCR
jgi:anti-sigma regulatory factor (Ser/Thr protein kinase)